MDEVDSHVRRLLRREEQRWLVSVIAPLPPSNHGTQLALKAGGHRRAQWLLKGLPRHMWRVAGGKVGFRLAPSRVPSFAVPSTVRFSSAVTAGSSSRDERRRRLLAAAACLLLAAVSIASCSSAESNEGHPAGPWLHKPQATHKHTPQSRGAYEYGCCVRVRSTVRVAARQLTDSLDITAVET